MSALAMAKRKGSSTSRLRARLKMAKEGSEAKTTSTGCIEDECDQLERKEEQWKQNLLTKKRRIEKVKNARRLDKLPQEIYEKVLDNLEENDLFPLALSCRYRSGS